MKIDASLPINGLPPAPIADSSSDRSAIAISADAVAQTPATPEGQNQPLDQSALQEGVDRLNQALQQVIPDVSLSVDPQTKKVVVKVVDQENNEVIYQFPSDDALRVSASLAQLSGIFLNRKA